MKKIITVRVSPEQEHKIQTMVNHGLGRTSDIIRAAIDAAYEKEIEIPAQRKKLIEEFSAFEIGYDEDIYDYPIEVLENLVTELGKLKDQGLLNVETNMDAIREVYERVV